MGVLIIVVFSNLDYQIGKKKNLIKNDELRPVYNLLRPPSALHIFCKCSMKFRMFENFNLKHTERKCFISSTNDVPKKLPFYLFLLFRLSWKIVITPSIFSTDSSQ